MATVCLSSLLATKSQPSYLFFLIFLELHSGGRQQRGLFQNALIRATHMKTLATMWQTSLCITFSLNYARILVASKNLLSLLCEVHHVTCNNLAVLSCDSRAAFTLMCSSIGTPKIINFPFVPNGKFIIFRCPKI